MMPRAVQQFRLVHPKVPITLQVAGSAAIRNLVAEGQLDLGLAADEIDHIDHMGTGFYAWRIERAVADFLEGVIGAPGEFARLGLRPLVVSISFT